jgi:hypothetical protein
MARYTYNRGDHMEIGFYLVFNNRGDVRLTRGAPGLASSERAMSMTAKLPHSLFKVPQLRGTINLTDQRVGSPEIDIAAAEAALTDALGAQVELTLKGDE